MFTHFGRTASVFRSALPKQAKSFSAVKLNKQNTAFNRTASADRLYEYDTNMLALAALQKIGEYAISLSGGIKYTADQHKNVVCETVIKGDILENVMGTTIEDLLKCKRSDISISNQCDMKQIDANSLKLSINVGHGNETQVSQVLSAELGLLSLMSKSSVPAYARARESSQARVNDEVFEDPRLPVP